MTNLQNHKAELENQIATLQHELKGINAQIEKELSESQLDVDFEKEFKKLTATQQRVMTEIYNLPVINEELGYYKFYNAEGEYRSRPSYGKLQDGTIEVRESSSTLKALAKKGFIELVEDGGEFSDRIKLLKGENKSVSMFETNNFIEVKAYLKDKRDIAQEVEPTRYNTKEFLLDGNIEYAKKYWDEVAVRANIAKVVNVKTGEAIYTA